MFDQPAVASADLRGGGPGTRESALLDPALTVERIDAITLSGGSAFGLDAASGVQAWLREQGRGFAIRDGARADRAGRDPVRPAQRRRQELGPLPPYRELGYDGRGGASLDFALGSAGAGLGATTADLKGGLGSASAHDRDGITVGALAVVNAAGCAIIGGGPHFWAAPFERDSEFGGRGWPTELRSARACVPHQGRPAARTPRWRWSQPTPR